MTMTDWYDNESLWVALYPAIFTQIRLAAAEAEAGQILTLAGHNPKTVLDLCCGPGRHSVAFARQGLRVTGVDKSPFLLDKAHQWSAKEGINVEWVQADMREFTRPDAFDLAVNLFTSFGYFDDKNDDRRVLQNLYHSLRVGGVLVMEMAGKEWLAKVFQPVHCEDLPDGSLFVQRHEIFDEWSRIRNKWSLIKDGLAKTFCFHHTVYSGQELKDRLLDAGFARVRLYGDFAGSEYGLDSIRLVAVAWK